MQKVEEDDEIKVVTSTADSVCDMARASASDANDVADCRS